MAGSPLDYSFDEKNQKKTLQVNPSSHLGGYHYETDVGRYITVFWQAFSNILYASTLLKSHNSWVPVTPRMSIPVASDAKKDTPITAVNWANGRKTAVFYLDDDNIIHERLTDDGGITWRDGELSALSVATRSFSNLSAMIYGDALKTHIRLYYQNSQNLIRELQVSVSGGRWHENTSAGSYDNLHAAGGTSIACGFRMDCNIVMTQDATGKGVQQFWRVEPRSWTIEPNKSFLARSFNRGARLGFIVDALHSHFYAYDNDSDAVIERVWDWGANPPMWRKPSVLPKKPRIPVQILSNFIVLGWPQDMDCTKNEIHLFSMDESGLLWDYLVGSTSGSSVSLL